MSLGLWVSPSSAEEGRQLWKEWPDHNLRFILPKAPWAKVAFPERIMPEALAGFEHPDGRHLAVTSKKLGAGARNYRSDPAALKSLFRHEYQKLASV